MIYNTHSHGVYIGQGSECKRRWVRGYAQTLPRGRCHNKSLQDDYNQSVLSLGHNDFIEFHVLRVMKDSTQQERERVEGDIICFFKDIGYQVYNVIDRPWMFNQQEMTENTKQKISKAIKKFYKTEKGRKLIETMAANREGKSYEEQYGIERALEIKQKIRENKLVEMNKPEVKENLSKQLLGKSNVERYGKDKAAVVKQKQSIARKGKYLGEESSRYIVLDNIQLLAPDGTIYTKIEGIKEFAAMHELSKNHLSELLSGKRKTHHGWKLLIAKSNLD